MTAPLSRAQADSANLVTTVFVREVTALLGELRAKALALLGRAPPIKSDEYFEGLRRAQEVFDTSLQALRSRLQGPQDGVDSILSTISGSEAQVAPLRNALVDLMEIAETKRDSIIYQARSRELQPYDPAPLGSWSFTYNNDGWKFLGPLTAVPTAAAPAPQAPPAAAYPPPQAAPGGYPQQPAPGSYPPTGYPPQQYPGYPPQQYYGQPGGYPYPGAPGGY